MPVIGIGQFNWSKFNSGTYGAVETFQVNMGPSTVFIQASLSDTKGSGRNKAGIAAIQGAQARNFGEWTSWPNCAFSLGCVGVTFGLSSTGNGGATGLYNLFYF